MRPVAGVVGDGVDVPLQAEDPVGLAGERRLQVRLRRVGRVAIDSETQGREVVSEEVGEVGGLARRVLRVEFDESLGERRHRPVLGLDRRGRWPPGRVLGAVH